jgi:malate dehydrogenase
VQLGKGGAERVIIYELTPDEQKALELSANAVRELCTTVDRLMA